MASDINNSQSIFVWLQAPVTPLSVPGEKEGLHGNRHQIIISGRYHKLYSSLTVSRNVKKIYNYNRKFKISAIENYNAPHRPK